MSRGPRGCQQLGAVTTVLHNALTKRVCLLSIKYPLFKCAYVVTKLIHVVALLISVYVYVRAAVCLLVGMASGVLFTLRRGVPSWVSRPGLFLAGWGDSRACPRAVVRNVLTLCAVRAYVTGGPTGVARRRYTFSG